jgi:TRAP-type uncharacterized transport system fused permease subunit
MAAILSVLITRVIVSIAVAMSAYHLYTGYFGAPEALLHRSIHLLFTLVLTFSLFPLSRKEWGEKFRWTDGVHPSTWFASTIAYVVTLPVRPSIECWHLTHPALIEGS